MTSSIMKHIHLSRVAENLQKEALQRSISLELEPIQQAARVCGDYTVTKNNTNNTLFKVGTKIEFKNDIRSQKTNRFYLEFVSTNDNWWSQYESGVTKAAKEGCLVVLGSGENNYVFSPTSLNQLFHTKGRICGTRMGANGNPVNLYTKGRLVTLKNVEALCDFRYTL